MNQGRTIVAMAAPIQPILRALDVLRALNHQPQTTLVALHRSTGLPKPTLHRLLSTLKTAGFVRSDVALGVYCLTAKVRELADGFAASEEVVELGAPIVLRATRVSGVPMAIGILERGRIVVRYSSMPYSPIAPEHTTLGHSHDLLHSGMGQAYFAWCSDAEREQLTLHLTSACVDEATAAALRSALALARVETRRRGFGLRLPEGVTGTATLAVPIACADGLLGVLSLTTFGTLMGNGRAQRRYAALLRSTSDEIIQAMGRGGGVPPCETVRHAEHQSSGGG